MKSKLLVILSTLVMALALMAQTATQTTPAPAGDTKTCSCCNHDKADGNMACCGKDGGCCKDGKCDMMSKDGKDAMTHEHMMSGDDKGANKCPMTAKDSNGKMSCCNKDGGCCKDGKCDMAKDGKSCCDGKQCARPQPGA
jgi:hypothetical protein